MLKQFQAPDVHFDPSLDTHELGLVRLLQFEGSDPRDLSRRVVPSVTRHGICATFNGLAPGSLLRPGPFLEAMDRAYGMKGDQQGNKGNVCRAADPVASERKRFLVLGKHTKNCLFGEN